MNFWTTAFTNAKMESAFLKHELPAIRKPITITLLLLAFVMCSTFLLDYSVFSIKSPEILRKLFFVRLFATSFCLLEIFIIHRIESYPLYLSVCLATVTVGCLTCLYVTLNHAPFITHSDSPIWYSALLLFALFGFPVPLKWSLLCGLIALGATGIYLYAMSDTTFSDIPRFTALLITFGATGISLSHRDNVKRRKQYVLLLEQHAINEQLSLEVAERKKVEAQLNLRKDQLEMRLAQTLRMESISLLAGGIAHDFNNLLVPMMGFAEIAERKLPKESLVIPLLHQIKLAGERARDLTRQLLAFGRKQVLEVKPLDINKQINMIETILRRLVREDIEVKTELTKPLGLILADPSQIEQIILNLAVNARDAMPNGGIMRIITAPATIDDINAASPVGSNNDEESLQKDFIRLSVADTGTGMNSHTIAHIFEPFFTTKPKGAGTGLGLSTVHGIVSQHKGRIAVKSTLDNGTQIDIFFPVETIDEESWSPESITEADLTDDETILLVEDEDVVRDFACGILEGYGYHVITARNGEEAVRIGEKEETQIHLLLTDVIMPKLSGPSTWRQLKDLRKDLRILYMSGYPDEELGQHGVLTEDIHFLHKPFSIQQLAQKVRNALNMK